MSEVEIGFMVVKSYVRAPLILFSHLHFVPSIRIVSPRKHCLLNNFVYNVDARLMGYKLEQFQSPRMHSSVTTGNSNTIQENKSTSYRHWCQNCGHKHATALQVKAVV